MDRACGRVSGLFATALLLVSLMGLLAEPASAQEPRRGAGGRIEGRVIDRESGEPLGGVTVEVIGTELGAVTTADGQYSIRSIPAGSYRLRLTRIGYAVEVVERVAVASGAVVRADVELTTQPVALPPLTAMGTAGLSQRERLERAVQTRSEASQAVVDVAVRTTQDYNSANAYDALRIVPGVSYLAGAGGRQAGPSRIRGGSSWVIADAIEDFPTLRPAGIGAEDGGYTADLGSSIPAISLRRIDVKKGSLGVLYSGGADGGVIVNRLKRGRPGGPTGAIWLELSPIAEQLLMADVGGGTETFDYYVAGKALSGSYRNVRDANGRALGEESFYSGLARLGYNPAEGMRIELFAVHGRDNIEYTQPKDDDAETADVDESTALPPDEFDTTSRNEFYGVTFDHALGGRSSYELGYSFVRNHALRFSVTEGLAHRDRPQRTHTAFGNVYLTRSLSEAIDYSAKLGFESVWHDQEEDARGSDKAQSFIDRSVFYSNTVSVGRGLFVTAGVRYVDAKDDFAAHDIWAYNGGISARIPGVETKARVAYSTGYSRNKGFAFFFGPIEEAGGVGLSENRTIEAGIDQPFSIAGGTGVLGITAFRTMNERVPVFSGWGAATVYTEDREVRGLELWAEHGFGRSVRVFGSFTHMKTEVVGTTHPEGVNVGNTGVRVPQYAGALGLEVMPVDRLRLSAIGTYDDGMRRREIDLQTGAVTITTNASYTRVNLAGSYSVSDRFSLRLRLENVLDQKDLGYSHETLGPDGYEFTETVATDPGRFLSLGFVVNY